MDAVTAPGDDIDALIREWIAAANVGDTVVVPPAPPAPPATPPLGSSRPAVEGTAVEKRAAAEDPRRGAETRQRVVAEKVRAGGPDLLRRLLDRLPGTSDPASAAIPDVISLFGAEAVPRLAELANSPDRATVSRALVALRSLAPHWAWDPVLGPVVCRAAARNPESGTACDVLATGRPAIRAVAADLAREWLASDTKSPGHWSHALGFAYSDAAPAAPAIVAWLRGAATRHAWDPAQHLFQQDERAAECLRVLEGIGSSEPAVLSGLREILADGPTALRSEIAFRVLVRWGDAAAAAEPELVAMLGAPDFRDRQGAACALAAIPSIAALHAERILAVFVTADGDARASIEPLGRLLVDGEIERRLEASIAGLPESKREVTRAILDGAREARDRRSAPSDAAPAGPRPAHVPAGEPATIPDPRGDLARSDVAYDTDWAALGRALVRLPATSGDVPAIVRAIRLHPSRATPALELLPVLERLGPRAAAAVPLLRVLVQRGGRADVSAAAARVLGAIGPAARGALPELRWAAALLPNGPADPDVGAAAREAIGRIEAAR